MNTCPEHIVHYMHAYLDGDISRDEERELRQHLESCEQCKEMMNGLTESIAFIGSAVQIQAPANFVNGVMARLPKEKSQAGFQRLLRRHPFLAAAAMFVILMSASLFSSYGNDQQFSVTKQPNLIVEGQTVLVPEGETVKGNIVVKNGELRIEGQVEGNVTVIHGSKYMASTAVVTGTSEEIDKVFDWLWYQMKTTFQNVFSAPSKEEPVTE
ncbi:zf-HC2 domain-containing protein [Sporosarcina beigongshangi]|uniref:zf-HC2 domain-containing protein n=1 Tax=Sporosarcina beigongshangi TaxID=2782538 RepID=UPI00193A2A09|nr:anti-sigma factor [Sporosarcina beigongshangi]